MLQSAYIYINCKTVQQIAHDDDARNEYFIESYT
jgi:hypothetical protein